MALIQQTLPLFPDAASTMAPKVDHLYFFLLSVTAVMVFLIFTTLFVFAIRYRRRSDSERPKEVPGSIPLELFWSAVPLVVVMIMFGWGARLYFLNAQVPPNAMQIYVVGKQWMWKIQHPEGPREINELHVPVNRPVQLIISSQDVIHSFYLPAFRIKRDAVPGTYTTEWFQATKPGTYHLFCAEYCGTNHSRMIGHVIVMEEAEYEQWLSGSRGGESMSSSGQQLFQRLGCANCHKQDGSGRCPPLMGLFGKGVGLQGGKTVIADEAYIRESILDPGAKVVAGYPNIMPTFKGLVNEDGIMQLIAYIKSLGTASGGQPAGSSGQSGAAPASGTENPRTRQATHAAETSPGGGQPR